MYRRTTKLFTLTEDGLHTRRERLLAEVTKGVHQLGDARRGTHPSSPDSLQVIGGTQSCQRASCSHAHGVVSQVEGLCHAGGVAKETLDRVWAAVGQSGQADILDYPTFAMVLGEAYSILLWRAQHPSLSLPRPFLASLLL